MPYRFEHFATGEMYHVFNRSVARQPIYSRSKDFRRMSELLDFYRFIRPPIRYSHYNRLPILAKQTARTTLISHKSLVTIHAYCIMPNHFHLVLRQEEDGGIPTFLSRIQNSYGKFYNTKYKRPGAVFQAMFKAVRIEAEEQLVHVVRYTHINPITSFVIKTTEELEHYPWSSLQDYLELRKNSFVETKLVRSYFKTLPSLRKFTYDQIGYQQELEKIRHLILEET